KRKPNLGGRAAGKLNTRDKNRNLSLKEITDTKGPVPIHFELRDKQTVMPLGDHAAHWSSYTGEAAYGIPRLDRDQRRHPAALAKGVQYQQGCFQGQHWVIDPTTGTYNVEKIMRERPKNITEEIRMLEAMCTYTYDEINRLARGGKQRGHVADVGRGGASGSSGCGDEEEGADHQNDEDEDGDGDT
nr:hypothetical protein [Tanacetum cinerariifolium]